MADISPVRDVNYENFNYGQLLNQAVSPIVQAGQNRLAIAQQQGQRMFELAAQRQQSESAARNRIAEIEAEAAARGKLSAQEAERIRNERDQQVFEQVKAYKPDWKPDPSKTMGQNAADAAKVLEDQTVNAAKANVDAGNKLQQDYIEKLKAAGLPPNIDPKQLDQIVGQKLAQDSDFIRSVSPELKKALADGSVSPQEAIDRLVSGRVGAFASGLWSGFNPNATAANLAQKAQQYRQAVIDNFHQSNLTALGAEGQAMMNRFTQNNEIRQKLIGAVPPHRLGEVMDYQVGNQQSGPLQSLASPAVNAAGVNPGVLGQLQGGAPPPVASTADANAIPAPIEPTPGLAAALDPSTYRQAARVASAKILADKSQKDLSDTQSRLQFLDQLLVNGTTDAPQTPGYAQWAASMAPRSTNAPPLTPGAGGTLCH